MKKNTLLNTYTYCKTVSYKIKYRSSMPYMRYKYAIKY